MGLAVEVGSVLPGGVRLSRLIGEGVFAEVYEAWLENGDRVAVKVLRERERDTEERFMREIQVSRALPKSPHVVGYRGHGRTADGRPWLAMECVDGFTLAAMMEDGLPLGESMACHLMLQICESFGGLHRLGIAHRDIKPANIMLTSGGRLVKLMDFGLVSDAQGLLRLMEQEKLLTGNVFTDDIDQGILAGTPEYMAPEQISDPRLQSSAAHRLDTSGDVYSLGVLFYQLLSGRKPFPFVCAASSDAEARRALMAYLDARLEATDDQLPPIEGLAPALWTVLQKALRSDAKLRQADSFQLYDDIRRFVDHGEGAFEDVDMSPTIEVDLDSLGALLERLPAPPRPGASPRRRPSGRGRVVAFGVLAAAVVAVTLIILQRCGAF